MCVAIWKPKDKKLDEAIYAESFRINKDGAGFAYVDDDGEIIVDKGFFDFESFYKALSEQEHREMIVHCRISTHGGISIDNCHPFALKSKTFPQFQFALAHNGTLPWKSTKDRSDTACFAEDFLFKHLDRDPYFLDSWTGQLFLEQLIGSHNKLIIMRYNSEKKETKHYIINSKAGNEAHGCWFSNYSWKVFTATNYSHGYRGSEDWEAQHGDPKAGADGMYGWTVNNGVWEHEDGRKIEKGKYVMPVKADGKEGGPAQATFPESTAQQPNPPLTPGAGAAEEIAQTHPAVSVTTGGTVVPFVQPRVEVPRDLGVLGPQPSLAHLSSEGKRILRREAADFLKFEGIDIKGWGDLKKIEKFRELIRRDIPGANELGVEALDAWIVQERDVSIIMKEKKEAGAGVAINEDSEM